MCKSLKHVTIPDSVTEIGYSSFSDCYSLESITIPASVRAIKDDAFESCYNLKKVKMSRKTVLKGWKFGEEVKIQYIKDRSPNQRKKSNWIQKTLD